MSRPRRTQPLPRTTTPRRRPTACSRTSSGRSSATLRPRRPPPCSRSAPPAHVPNRPLPRRWIRANEHAQGGELAGERAPEPASASRSTSRLHGLDRPGDEGSANQPSSTSGSVSPADPGRRRMPRAPRMAPADSPATSHGAATVPPRSHVALAEEALPRHRGASPRHQSRRPRRPPGWKARDPHRARPVPLTSEFRRTMALDDDTIVPRFEPGSTEMTAASSPLSSAGVSRETAVTRP